MNISKNYIPNMPCNQSKITYSDKVLNLENLCPHLPYYMRNYKDNSFEVIKCFEDALNKKTDSNSIKEDTNEDYVAKLLVQRGLFKTPITKSASLAIIYQLCKISESLEISESLKIRIICNQQQ